MDTPCFAARRRTVERCYPAEWQPGGGESLRRLHAVIACYGRVNTIISANGCKEQGLIFRSTFPPCPVDDSRGTARAYFGQGGLHVGSNFSAGSAADCHC